MRPSKEYLNRIMYYYPIRSKLFKHLEQQVSVSHDNNNISHAIRCEENVKAVICMCYILRGTMEVYKQ